MILFFFNREVNKKNLLGGQFVIFLPKFFPQETERNAAFVIQYTIFGLYTLNVNPTNFWTDQGYWLFWWVLEYFFPT